MNSSLPADFLEHRAAEQRSQLQHTVIEFRRSVKDRLDLKRNLRDHLWPVAGATAVVGLLLGYLVAGVLTRD